MDVLGVPRSEDCDMRSSNSFSFKLGFRVHGENGRSRNKAAFDWGLCILLLVMHKWHGVEAMKRREET